MLKEEEEQEEEKKEEEEENNEYLVKNGEHGHCKKCITACITHAPYNIIFTSFELTCNWMPQKSGSFHIENGSCNVQV